MYATWNACPIDCAMNCACNNRTPFRRVLVAVRSMIICCSLVPSPLHFQTRDRSSWVCGWFLGLLPHREVQTFCVPSVPPGHLCLLYMIWCAARGPSWFPASQVKQGMLYRQIFYIKLENVKGRNHLRDLGTDGKIILKWTLVQWGVKTWTGFKWLVTGSTNVWCCEHVNKHSGSTRAQNFLTSCITINCPMQLVNYLHQNNCAF